MSNKSTASTHQFVICAINIETATNRKFLQAFTNQVGEDNMLLYFAFSI